MNKSKKIKDISFVVVLVFLSTLFCFARTFEDSLRFDEAMEYLISSARYSEMNPLIRSTFQPPLYNYIMHLWLGISDSVVWFKFFNLACYSLGTLAIIKIMECLQANKFVTVLAILCQCGFSGLIYYSQICGEYVLAFVSIYWMIYAALRMVREPNWKSIILYMFMATIGIYAQYGVAFAIIGTAATAGVYFLLRKDYKSILKLAASGLVSIIFFVLPLYFFFVRVQTANQGSELKPVQLQTMLIGCKDAIQFSVFGWHEEYMAVITKFLMVSFVAMLGIVLFDFLKGRKHVEKNRSNDELLFFIFGVVIIGLLAYLPAVDSGVYAYGNYSSRHTTLVMPLMIVLICACVQFFIQNRANNICKILISAILLFDLGILMMNSVDYNLIEHWDYDQIDEGLAIVKNSTEPVWISKYAIPTALAYSGFDDYQEIFEEYYMKGVTYQRAQVVYSATDDIMEDFANELPQACLVLTTDQDSIMNETERIFAEQGYIGEVILENRGSRMAAGTRVVRYYLD